MAKMEGLFRLNSEAAAWLRHERQPQEASKMGRLTVEAASGVSQGVIQSSLENIFHAFC
jgi:hypothetical protein